MVKKSGKKITQVETKVETKKEAEAETAVDALDYEELPKKKGGFKKFAIIFLIVVLVLGAGAFAMYYAYNYFMKDSNSEYTSSISDIKTSIDKMNGDMAKVLKTDEALPTSDILTALSPTYDALKKIDEGLGKSTPPSSYSAAHSKLLEAVKLNKTIYQQLESIIKNPVDPNAEKNIKSFTDNIEQCMNDYLSVDIKNYSFTLPNEIQNLPSRVESWSKQEQSKYAEISSLIASFTEYFDSMSKILVNFDSARADITQALNKAKADRSSWVDALSIIDDNENAVMLIKDSYNNLKVPSQLSAFNKEFAPILDDTLSYYVSLRLAIQADMESTGQGTAGGQEVTNDQGTTTGQGATEGQGTNDVQGTEQSQGTGDGQGATVTQGVKSAAEIEKMYQDAEKLNSSAAMNYQKFTSSYSVQKDKFMNPDYVMTLK